MPDLAGLIAKQGSDLRLRQAIVTAAPSGGKCTIRFGDLASTTTADDIPGVQRLSSVPAKNGDTVLVLQTGGVLLIIGKVGGAPACKAYHNTTQSIPHAALTTISLNSEVYDTDGMHDLVTSNSRLTVKTPGVYEVTFTIMMAANVTGIRACSVLVNGAEQLTYNANAASAFDHRIVFSINDKFAVNDYIEMAIYQTSGGALSTVNGTGALKSPSIAAMWMGLGT